MTEKVYVSIHASVKDATSSSFIYKVNRRVSIHASVKDATRGRGRVPFPSHRFNPRVREGRDVLLGKPVHRLLVSIHASVKDATFWVSRSRKQCPFQSTRP